MGPPSTKGHGMMTPAGYIPKQEMVHHSTRRNADLKQKNGNQTSGEEPASNGKPGSSGFISYGTLY